MTTHDWALHENDPGATCRRCIVVNPLETEEQTLMLLGTHDGEPLDLDTSSIDFNRLLDGSVETEEPVYVPCSLN